MPSLRSASPSLGAYSARPRGMCTSGLWGLPAPPERQGRKQLKQVKWRSSRSFHASWRQKRQSGKGKAVTERDIVLCLHGHGGVGVASPVRSGEPERPTSLTRKESGEDST